MDTRTGINSARPKKPFDVMALDLGQIIWVLCEYNFSFEQQKVLTLQQIADTFDDINANKYKTIHQLQEEAKEARKKK